LAMLIDASPKGDGLSPQQHLIGTTHATAAAATTAVVAAAIAVEDSAAAAAGDSDPAELGPADSEYISTAALETPATGLSPSAVVTAADFVVQVAAVVAAAAAAAVADSVVVHSVLVAQSVRLLAYDNSSIAPAAPDASSYSTAVDFDSTAVDFDSTAVDSVAAVDFAVAATVVAADSTAVESAVVVAAALDS